MKIIHCLYWPMGNYDQVVEVFIPYRLILLFDYKWLINHFIDTLTFLSSYAIWTCLADFLIYYQFKPVTNCAVSIHYSNKYFCFLSSTYCYAWLLFLLQLVLHICLMYSTSLWEIRRFSTVKHGENYMNNFFRF